MVGWHHRLSGPVLSKLWELVVDRAEKAMAPHSSTLAWKIPWMEEPGRLQFMGSLGVRHDGATSLTLSLSFQGVSIFYFMAAITICSDFGAQKYKV